MASNVTIRLHVTENINICRSKHDNLCENVLPFPHLHKIYSETLKYDPLKSEPKSVRFSNVAAFQPYR